MLTVIVTDCTVEATDLLYQEIQKLLSAPIPGAEYTPEEQVLRIYRSDIRPSSIRAVCIVGPRLLTTEPQDLGRLRLLLPRVFLLAKLSSRLNCIETVQKLASYGVHDFLPASVTPEDFRGRLSLLQTRSYPSKPTRAGGTHYDETLSFAKG